MVLHDCFAKLFRHGHQANSPVHRTSQPPPRTFIFDVAEFKQSNQIHWRRRCCCRRAGIIGLCYAIHLKNISPQLKIEVFEKSPAPVQKIGESTLSSFARFLDGASIPQDYLLRLFGLKDGLQFYCIDQHGLSVTSEDVGGLDLSFQLDRRMSG